MKQIRQMLAMITAMLGMLGCQQVPVGEVLPAEFVDDRIFLVPTTADGKRVRFYTDTGGGWNAIKRSVAKEFDASLSATVPFPEFVDDTGIPANPLFMDGNLVVVEDEQLGADVDGFLGGRWFGDRVWKFDYLDQKLVMLDEHSADSDDSCKALDLGFQVNSQGQRTMHFPRMSVEIDGESLDLLLDTGARATLSQQGAAHFGRKEGVSVGSSFINQSVFDRWTARHPDWTVVENADLVQGNRYTMIEVPEVTIAGHTVGSVWFAVRPDYNFVEYMSSMMDRTIFGAVGGSAFRYFRIIIDYPESKAYFCVE